MEKKHTEMAGISKRISRPVFEIYIDLVLARLLVTMRQRGEPQHALT